MQTRHDMRPVDSKPGEPHQYSERGAKCTEIHKSVKLPVMTAAIRQVLACPVSTESEEIGTDYIEECMARMRAVAGRERSRFPESDG